MSLALPLPALGHRGPKPSRRARIEFNPVGPESANAGRNYVRILLNGCDQNSIDYSLIVASELVTNAHMHGGRRASLQVSTDGGRIQLVVSNSRRWRREADRPEEEGGYGLIVADALTDRLDTKRRILGGRTVTAVISDKEDGQ